MILCTSLPQSIFSYSLDNSVYGLQNTNIMRKTAFVHTLHLRRPQKHIFNHLSNYHKQNYYPYLNGTVLEHWPSSIYDSMASRSSSLRCTKAWMRPSRTSRLAALIWTCPRSDIRQVIGRDIKDKSDIARGLSVGGRKVYPTIQYFWR